MSNFIYTGIRNVVKTIKLHKYIYRDDEEYVKKLNEYESSLNATLDEIENIELIMESNMKHSDNLSIHELTDVLENGIGGLMYYYYGIKEYLSTVSNTLHNREMRKLSEFMEKVSKSEEYAKFKEEILESFK
nr:MAG TPA: hypothetical protein [Caudoviricetes sp.]